LKNFIIKEVKRKQAVTLSIKEVSMRRRIILLFIVILYLSSVATALADRCPWLVQKALLEFQANTAETEGVTVDNTDSESSETEKVIDENEFVYLVKRGDTLGKISQRYATSISDIMAINPEITNANRIFVGQSIRIDKGIEKSVEKGVLPSVLLQEEKILVLKRVEARTGVPWEILAGLAYQESGFGRHLIGDHGTSFGPFQIHLPAHPEVTRAQAMNWRWSANWTGDYLVKKLGANDNLFKALRLWNGSCKNPRTKDHATAVVYHAKHVFGLRMSI
jgi:hypothetical protein